MNRISIILALVSLIVTAGVQGQDRSEFEKNLLIQSNDTLPYRVLMPANFEESTKYPLILFLHGAGERGADNESQLTHGAQMFLSETNRNTFPAIVIFPQCKKEDYWASMHLERTNSGVKLDFSKKNPATMSLVQVQYLIDSIRQQPYIDPTRIYVMGLSMGGMGTFEIVARNPDLFAAAIPICGAGDPELASAYAENTAFWIFHGAVDSVVDPMYSLVMAEAIRKNGGEPAITIYPYTNHNSWEKAFNDPALMPWLFSHSKKPQ